MKQFKFLSILIICVLFVIAAGACTDKKPNQYTLVYMAGDGGKVTGEQIQIVDEGSDAETVTAVPNSGYEFVGWSDGVQEAERTDTNVKGDIDVTANFKKTSQEVTRTKSFSLDYKFGICEDQKHVVTFKRNDFKTIDFPVPEREHFTFGGWYCGETQVTNENGKMTIGKDLLQSDQTEIHAKWTADETFTYKVLLVYVTEIDAELRDINNSPVKVEYKMSDLDRRVSEQTTVFFREALNSMTDGLVNFEVDEYYTKNVVTTDEFTLQANYNETRREAYLDFSKTKEVQELYDDYYSVLTIYNMEDYEGLLHYTGGSGTIKFGVIHSEMNYSQLFLDGFDGEELLNSNWRDYSRRWASIIYNMLHEFTHTLECRAFMPLDFDRDDHTATSVIWESFLPKLTGDAAQIMATKWFFLNEIELNGEKVGMPYEFWKKMNGKDYDHPINY